MENKESGRACLKAKINEPNKWTGKLRLVNNEANTYYSTLVVEYECVYVCACVYICVHVNQWHKQIHNS